MTHTPARSPMQGEVSWATEDLLGFSSAIAHDFRAPLRAISGFAGLLVEECGAALDDQGRRYVEVIRSSAAEMDGLLDGLNEYASVARHQISRSEQDPGELAGAAWDTLVEFRGERKVVLTIGELPPCWADGRLLERVFAELLTNAVKFTAGREPATISVGFDRETLAYSVADDGVGFDPRYADKMFGPFQRMHRAEDYPGVGVGLAIVSQIVRRHGGRVSAQVEHEGGATFRFTIPGGSDA